MENKLSPCPERMSKSKTRSAFSCLVRNEMNGGGDQTKDESGMMVQRSAQDSVTALGSNSVLPV